MQELIRFMQKGNQWLLLSGVSGILALILVWPTPTAQSSSNYLFGTEGSSQISPLSSDLLWAEGRAAEETQGGVASSHHCNQRLQQSARECSPLVFWSLFIWREVLDDCSEDQLLLFWTSSLLLSISSSWLPVYPDAVSVRPWEQSLASTGRLAGSTEVGARTGEACHLCHGDLVPALTFWRFFSK